MDDEVRGTPPAARAAIDSLKNKTLEAKDLEEPSELKGESCVICQEPYVADETIAWLDDDVTICGHYYHTGCINAWLERHNSCPVCRYELPTEDADYEVTRMRRNEELQRRRHGESPAARAPAPASATAGPTATVRSEEPVQGVVSAGSDGASQLDQGLPATSPPFENHQNEMRDSTE
eukprot:Selendium_serpulae@DN6074_c0_g1_i2.p1